MSTPSVSNLHTRRASYDLLARLYLDELEATQAAELRALPPFAACVPPEPATDGWLAELAVEYQRLFGMNVYPYESVFVDRELMLNTAATDQVALLYATCGFDTSRARVGALDHLGLELRLMSALIAVELGALQAGDPITAQESRGLQARCLHEHLARWAPLCARTVARVTAQPIYALLATLTTELTLSDLAAFPPPLTLAIPLASQEPSSLPPTADADDIDPESPLPLHPYHHDAPDDDERGVNAIVRQLITPADVGVLLTRADLIGIGRALQLPSPIGERFQMLRGLFDAAGQFEQIPALIEALDRFFAQEGEYLATLIANYPAWSAHGEEWQRRVAGGRALLAELRAQARAFEP